MYGTARTLPNVDSIPGPGLLYITGLPYQRHLCKFLGWWVRASGFEFESGLPRVLVATGALCSGLHLAQCIFLHLCARFICLLVYIGMRGQLVLGLLTDILIDVEASAPQLGSVAESDLSDSGV